MNAVIAIFVILIDCLLAWLLSASPLPLAISLLVGLIGMIAVSAGLRFRFLTAFFFAISLGCAQYYLFQSEQAFVVLSELPVLFHLGIALHWTCLLTGSSEYQRPGNALFWTALTGSAIVFSCVSRVDVVEQPLWLIRFISILPIVWIVWGGFFHHRKPNSLSILILSGFTLLLGGAATSTPLIMEQVQSLLKNNGDENEVDKNDLRPTPRSSSGTSTTDSRELATRANISFDHQVRFYAQTDDQAAFQNWSQKPIYARTSSLALFEGDSKLTPLRKGKWLYDTDDGMEDSSTLVAQEAGKTSFSYSMLINRSEITQLPVLSGTTRIGLDSVYEFAEGWYQITVDEEIEWIRYRAIADWEYSIFPEGETSWVTSSIFPAPLESPFLSLPDTALGKRVKAKTDSLLKNLPPERHAQTIASYVRENCRYSLNYQNPKSLPPVENFLFAERKGHCELFAVATAMMLRSAGIPSRIAYGYAGGQSDGKSQIIAFRDSDFHSWAEILLADGHTWAVFDTTPRDSDSARHPPIRSDLGAINLNRYEDIGNLGYASIEEGFSTGTIWDDILNSMSLHFLALLGSVLVLVGIFWLWHYWKKGEQRSLFSQAIARVSGQNQKQSPAPAIVNAIAELGKSYGFEKGKSQTLGEFINVLRSNGIGSPELFQAVDYLYQVRYAGKERDSSDETDFLRDIRKLISAAS